CLPRPRTTHQGKARTPPMNLALSFHAGLPSRLGIAALLLPVAVSAQLKLTTYATGFSSPLFATTPPGDRDRLFVVERGGTIRVIVDGTVQPRPFLDLGSRVLAGGERGLLGLAFHPRYASNGYFFVCYTRSPDGASMVERYRVSSGNPNVADPNVDRRILGPVAQPFSNHNGGGLAFGPDGYLYVSLGDGGSAGDPSCNAQRGDTLLGKVLRLDVDTPGTIVPATNPFVNDPNVRDEIWALGLRNPWRFSFDRLTGDLYIGDVGQNAIEEIDFQPANSRGGENYGWKIMEGTRCFSTASCPAGVPACNSPVLNLPIHEYTHSGGACSVTAGYVYRGCGVPSLRGTYFFGDYCAGTIWSFRYVNGQISEFRQRTDLGRVNQLSSFAEDADGELYVISLSGTVYRIESTETTANDLGFGTVGSNGRVPRFEVCGLLSPGESAVFRLDRAPPMQAAGLLVSRMNSPTNLPPFGTVVPYPPEFGVPFVTDAAGTVEFSLPGGTGAVVAYAQFAIFDPQLPAGVVLSNALEIFFK